MKYDRITLLGREPWYNLDLSETPMPRWMSIYKSALDDGENYEPAGSWQWKFTPKQVVEKMVNFVSDLFSLKICVIVNVEIAWWLIDLGVDPANIVFLGDNDPRIEISKKAMKIKTDKLSNFGKYQKKFDLAITNSKFGDQNIARTERICQLISKNRYILITDSAYYHNKTKRLENTEVFKHLGLVFYDEGTAKIGAIAVIKNLKEPSEMKVVGEAGEEVMWPWSNGMPLTAPSKNPVDWAWAEKILSMKLPGYSDCKKGAAITRTDVKFRKNGTIVKFTAGGRESEFDSTNFADEKLCAKWNTRQNEPPNERKKQAGMEFNTTCWTTAEVSDYEYKQGGGEVNKALISYATPDHTGRLIWKFSEKGEVIGNNAYWFPVKNKKDFEQETAYFAEEKTIRLIRVLQSGAITGSKQLWNKIPRKEYKDQWR